MKSGESLQTQFSHIWPYKDKYSNGKQPLKYAVLMRPTEVEIAVYKFSLRCVVKMFRGRKRIISVSRTDDTPVMAGIIHCLAGLLSGK